MRISDWSSDVCSSDLVFPDLGEQDAEGGAVELVDRVEAEQNDQRVHRPTRRDRVHPPPHRGPRAASPPRPPDLWAREPAFRARAPTALANLVAEATESWSGSGSGPGAWSAGCPVTTTTGTTTAACSPSSAARPLPG